MKRHLILRLIPLLLTSFMVLTAVGCGLVRPAEPSILHPAYGVQIDRRTLVVIDTDQWQVAKTIPLPKMPAPAVAVAPNGKVYVPLSGGLGIDAGSSVAVYTPDSGSITEIKVGRIPYDAVVTPQGIAYIMNQDGGHHGTLSAIDTRNDRVTGTVDIGLMPQALAMSRDGRWGYVLRQDPNYLYGEPFGFDPNPRPDEPPPAAVSIVMFDAQAAEVVKIVGLAEGSSPGDMVWAQGKLYLTLASSQTRPENIMNAGKAPGNKVIVLDGSTLEVIQRIVVPARPYALAWSAQGKLYVGHFDSQSGGISVVETRTGSVLKELELPLALGGGPAYPRLAPFWKGNTLGTISGTNLYIPGGGAIVDTETDALVTQIKGGDLTEGIASYVR